MGENEKQLYKSKLCGGGGNINLRENIISQFESLTEDLLTTGDSNREFDIRCKTEQENKKDGTKRPTPSRKQCPATENIPDDDDVECQGDTRFTYKHRRGFKFLKSLQMDDGFHFDFNTCFLEPVVTFDDGLLETRYVLTLHPFQVDGLSGTSSRKMKGI